MSSYVLTRGSLNARQAVERLREVIGAGELPAYLAVDRHSGEPLRGEARPLFAALPTITPSSSPEELVENGLLTALPQNLRRAFELPRYRVGREVFVRTKVSHRQREACRPVGYYDAEAPETFTHRAVLRGASSDVFLVELEGAPSLLPFLRANIYAWNEPTGVPTQGGSISGVQIDYNDPLLKAHICAGYLDIAALLPRLDFTLDSPEQRELQARLIHRAASRVRMDYSGRGEGYAGARAGALLSGGQGVCFVQRAAASALLAAFARPLAFDLQIAVGRTLRLGVPHGFSILTLRPSLIRYVVDPAWGEPLTDLRIAFFDAAWGHDRRLEGFEGSQEIRVPAEAVSLPHREAP